MSDRNPILSANAWEALRSRYLCKAPDGEITLRGKVLPVGRIKEKVLAAHRAGIRTIILPKGNIRDLDEIPESLRREMEFIGVDTISEVIQRALEPARLTV